MSTPIPSNTGRRTSSDGARLLLVVAALASLALWYIPGAYLVAYPIRLFVTLVHEGGHAFITIATGGHVQAIAIRPDTSGVTTSLGGMPFLIYMAGYLGATAFGAGCLLANRHVKAGRRTLSLMAAVALLVTGLWIHPWVSLFGFATGLGVGLVLLLLARSLPERAAGYTAAFLAVQLCLNALFDVRDLVWMTTSSRMDNDAVFMAQAYGFTPWFWALLWAGGAAAILAATLRVYWRGER